MESLPDIAHMAAAPAFRDYLARLLVEICCIDTTTRADVESLREAESEVFDVIERELKTYGLPASRCARQPIDPAIEKHPFFTSPFYTRSPERPNGLTAEQTYAGRNNLCFFVDGDERRDLGVRQAFNAHVDVVAPFSPPRVDGDRVIGRGTCDDKGLVVSLMGAMRLLGAFAKAQGLRLNRDVTVMFVIEEEMGGNGSLSAAIDPGLAQCYDSMMVVECTENRIHPGNRGAVWYRIDWRLSGVDLFEAAAFIVEALESEGRALRAESDHPLFPHRPVQTCHGILGPWGRHPSRINAEVCFDIRFEGGRPEKAKELIDRAVAAAIAEYVGLYGDKTQVVDPDTGKPKVDHHVEIARGPDGYLVRVLGASGHMAATAENDNAITKMAAIVRALVRERLALEAAAGGRVLCRLHDWRDPHKLVMEGGQGFLPTHTMEVVQDRLRRTACRGACEYLRLLGSSSAAAEGLRVTYDKLHNAAFAGAPDSLDVRNAVEAAKAAGIWKDEPIRGFDASCDARIFACQYPRMPVLTAGPGKLALAHSDQESIGISEMGKAAEFLAYFILKQTGTLS
jgi:acetylornithine deacetylase/succinyl-diaminopimelate desuccinylase-like protein